MSFEITSSIICDNCGNRRTAEPEKRIGYAKIAAQRLRQQVEGDGWVTVSRGRYHTEAHYCPNCKDQPIKPIKKGKRKPKRKRPPCTIIGLDPVDPSLAADWWKTGDADAQNASREESPTVSGTQPEK